MTFLPIVERELRIAARLTATYRNRAIAAGAVMFVALVMLVFGMFASSPSRGGAIMFKTLSFLAMLFCVLEGVRKTADCLSEEKREGTLGLLFLTDLKGYDVVLGKLAATSLNSVYGLFAILPVLALPLLVGGVTQQEYWRMVLALGNILFFSLCLGMLVSALCREESRAMGSTLLLVLAFMLLPGSLGIPSIALFSPAHAYSHAFATNYFGNGQEYWKSLGITQALSWLMLGIASVMLPRWWQDTPAGTPRLALPLRWPGLRSRHDQRRKQQRLEMLAINPAMWLAARDARARIFLWLLIAATAAGGFIYIFIPGMASLFAVFGIINFILKMRVAAQACHCLAEARRNNALEMLLATPLTVNEIIQGQLLALRRIFLAPVIAILAIEASAIFLGIGIENTGNPASAEGAFTMVIGMMYLALFMLDIVALTWAGMWFGLSAKKETQAVIKTILLVLILPYASFFFCWFGVVLYVGVPIFWIGWCSSKLKAEFRTLAAQRYAPQATSPNWLPRANAQPPPLPSP